MAEHISSSIESNNLSNLRLETKDSWLNRGLSTSWLYVQPSSAWMCAWPRPSGWTTPARWRFEPVNQQGEGCPCLAFSSVSLHGAGTCWAQRDAVFVVTGQTRASDSRGQLQNMHTCIPPRHAHTHIRTQWRHAGLNTFWYTGFNSSMCPAVNVGHLILLHKCSK